MSRRVLIRLMPLALLGAALAALPTVRAQAPVEPPRVLPATVTGRTPDVPNAPVVPVSETGRLFSPNGVPDAPIRRFVPFDAYPPATQAGVRSYLLGATWLARQSQPQGRFQYGYLPALRQALDSDDDLKQAHAAYAMARAAHFTGEARYAAVAGQALLALLTATRVDADNPTVRVPMPTSPACNRVAFAGVLALGIYALPGADERLVAEAERLCGFLRTRLQADGSVRYADATDDASGVNEHPGYGLHALAVSQRFRPAAWKADALMKGLTFYRGHFRAKPHPMFAATLTPAFAEWYLQTKSADAAAFVFELNDWLAALQYPTTDARQPSWIGGFKSAVDGRQVESQPGAECAQYLLSLACACRVTRHVPDVARHGQYRQALVDGLPFLSGLQYTEPNTRHFENSYRAGTLIGGFVLSPTDGNLRVDTTAHALSALLGFLESGAEKG